MDEKCIRALVSGRVQGVFFRASTREQALRNGVIGYARNLPDGRVEVVAQGDPEGVDQLVSWLHKGPAAARVDRVDVEAIEAQWLDGFETR